MRFSVSATGSRFRGDATAANSSWQYRRRRPGDPLRLQPLVPAQHSLAGTGDGLYILRVDPLKEFGVVREYSRRDESRDQVSPARTFPGGAIRALDQIRVPGSHRANRRTASSSSDPGVRRALPHRADTSGIGQSADRGRSRTRIRHGRPTRSRSPKRRSRGVHRGHCTVASTPCATTAAASRS